MVRRALRQLSFASLLLAATMLGIAASASAAQLVINGDFETGTLAGWTTTDQIGKDNFVTYTRQEIEEHPIFFPPPDGEHAAYAFAPTGEADTVYLYQDVTLPPASGDQLSLYLYYAAGAPFATPNPDTLAVWPLEGARPNQQIRVDVLKPNAPIESLSPNDILSTVYATMAGDPVELGPTLLNADLSTFAGQTVRLRVAAAVQGDGLQVGIDDVSIESTLIPPPPSPPPTWSPPSNAFSIGKLIRDREHGGAKLVVSLPGAGNLTVADAERGVAIASARPIPQEPPIMVHTAAVRTSGPRTVRVFLRPTKPAKKILVKRGRLPVHLQLTFTPEGGMTATQGYAGTLLRRVRR
jgi:hypothetical protein